MEERLPGRQIAGIILPMVKKKINPATPTKLYLNLSRTLLQFMNGSRYKPMKLEDLFESLNITEKHHSLFKTILKDLTKEKKITFEKNLYGVKQETPVYTPTHDVVIGHIRMHPRGFGFLIPEDPFDCPLDIFIPKHLTLNAIDGDKVEVEVNPEMVSEKGPEGKIISILERARSQIAGTIHYIDEQGRAYAHAPLLGNQKTVCVETKTPLKAGDRVLMSVKKWGDEKGDKTLCELIEVIGNIENPIYDIPAAVAEFEIKSQFSKEAIKQAKSYGKSVTKADQKARVDLTHLTTITIDPDTAKDFDDALAISKDKNGNYHLSVHIADVAHYVSAGSPLDTDAILRCNSTYFPGKCIPMLPEELSNELCSLKPKVIRLTVSVLMTFDPEGNLVEHEIVRGFIKSRKRMTYEEAKTIIDGKKSPYSKSLKLMVEMCRLLKRKRYERGSIDFALPEFVIIIDPEGNPTGTKWIEYDISHQLVEEFMLKANEVVAKTLTERGTPPIYRVHEEPAEENILEFFALARSLGFQMPESPTHHDIQELFETIKGTPYAAQLSVAFIRSMKLASYSPENVGHYGLALEHYCHFTSPIRRYSDLITERLLFGELGEDVDLDHIALSCSEKERVSFKAETSVKLLKKLRLLERYLKDDPQHTYEAIITRIKPFGLYFEIKELMIEGFLHISELENDYFVYYHERNILKGRASGKTHSVGQPIKVQLLSVDLVILENKWSLVTPQKRRT